MKITILNGSPKSKQSVTMQYVKYLEKQFPDHEYTSHSISSQIKKLEKNKELFDSIMADIESSDCVIWSTPVYTLFVPAQYMRFIELIHEREAAHIFKDKSAVVMTSSIHFYDHTAHRYMQAICDDLGMKYLGFYSAEMDDLRKTKGRETLKAFGSHFIESALRKTGHQKRFLPITSPQTAYVAEPGDRGIDANDKPIIVVTDHGPHEENIRKMIQRFSDSFSRAVKVINLKDLHIQGGCTGCIKCGYDNTCMYKDEFSQFYRTHILSADIIVYAMTLSHRNFSSRFKEFFDRRFFMNHVPELQHKQIGFLISGPLSQMPYITDFCQGIIEWQQANLAGIVCDESGNSDEISRAIQSLAEAALTYSKTGYCPPQTFLGVGASKIFRDDIWGKLRFVFQADYRYYKANKFFNFPHKNLKSRLNNFILMQLTKIPGFRKVFYSRIKTEMVKPHKKIVDESVFKPEG